jgi:hypothetical protein
MFFQARDFVVGKDAVAGALAKVKANSSASLAAVEQEQIRNMYRKVDGSYSAYMCKQCSFGPIEHFACSGVCVFARMFSFCVSLSLAVCTRSAFLFPCFS